MYFETECIMAV